MRKFTSGTIAVLLAGAGLAITAAPASAHTPAASATCEAIAISATAYETKPASGEPTIPNPDYVPAIPGTPAVGEPTIVIDNPDYVPATDPVTVTEYEWRGIFDNWGTIWSTDRPYFGWWKTGQERVVETHPGTPAVGEPTITVPNPDYVPSTDPVPAQGEPTIPNPEYVEADATPNTVTVTVDGDEVYAAEFGQSHDATIPLDGSTGHDWIASFVGWNGIGTQTLQGTTEPCELPHTPPTPGAVTFADHSCDALGTFTVPESEGVAYMITTDQANGASARIWPGDYYATSDRSADGDPFYGEVTITAHDLTDAAVLDTFVFDFTEATECETPTEPEEPTEPTEPEEPTTPTTPEEPTTVDEPTDETPTVTAALSTDEGTLAQTGADPVVTVWGLTVGAVAVALGALSVVLGLRRRQMNQQ